MGMRVFSSLAVALWLAAATSAQEESTAPATESTRQTPAQSTDSSADGETAAVDAPAKSEQADPIGTWMWTRDFGGNRSSMYLRLAGTPAKLTGTYQMVPDNGAENMPAEMLRPVPIRDVVLKGDVLTFQVVRSFRDNEFAVDFSGKIKGDEIAGQVEMDFGGEAREFPWNAKRVVAAEDVAGRWSVKFETPQGSMESSFTINNEDGKLSGTYHSQYFGDVPMQDVALKDAGLTFGITFGEGDRQFSPTYEAKPRGDEITGVIHMDFGGEQRETPFTGKRLESPKQPATGDAAPTEEDDTSGAP